jgi:DNA polymerase III delta prime subunit
MDKLIKIKQALAKGKLSHALLIESLEGSQSHFEDLFRAILCEKGSSCGQCDSCQTPLDLNNEKRSHPDFFYATPQAELSYSVDQVREWGGQFLFLAKNISPRKLLVISSAEKLSASTQAPANALLKILEEPRPDIFILLLTSKPYKLLATIRSRCLKISFKEETKGFSSKKKTEDSLFNEIIDMLLIPQGSKAQKSQFSNPTWWKERALRIEELENIHAQAWDFLKNRLTHFSKEEALHFWARWKHFEDFILAVKQYGNPPLHWLNLKRKIKGNVSWRTLKLFG